MNLEGKAAIVTGAAREETLSESTKGRIRVTRDKVRIGLPTKLNKYNPKGPNMAEEVRHVTRRELDTLQENLVIDIEDELDKEVPEQLRNRGEIGGRVKRLRLKQFRQSANPVERRKAA